MKKTTLLIFLVLILASWTGAYVFGEGFLDDIMEDYKEEASQIIEDKHKVMISLNTVSYTHLTKPTNREV